MYRMTRTFKMDSANRIPKRACMYKEALCFKQVVADTKAALRLERENPSDEGMTKTMLMHPGTAKPFE